MSQAQVLTLRLTTRVSIAIPSSESMIVSIEYILAMPMCVIAAGMRGLECIRLLLPELFPDT